jgi:hypothetical protein
MEDGPHGASIEEPPVEWAQRFARPLRLDPSSPVDQLLVAHLGDKLEAIPAHALVPPVSEGRRRAIEGAIENFGRWCVLEQQVAQPADVKELPLAVLRRAIEGWLAWRLTTIPKDHPLVGHAVFGQRAAVACQSIDSLRAALKWWATMEGLGDVLTNRALSLTGVSEAARSARALTDADLKAVIEALLAEEIVEGITPTVTKAWHARQLAMINIALVGSIRPTAEVGMLRDRNLVSVTDDLVGLRLPRTKLHPEGRVIGLHQRDDPLCPLWALTRFLAICASAGWKRAGYLLPAVHCRRYQPLGPPVGSAAALDSYRSITDHLDIHVDLETGLNATPHGLRAMTPTRAFAKGVDVRAVQRFTDHTTLEALSRYDQSGAAPDSFTVAMAADMANGSLV